MGGKCDTYEGKLLTSLCGKKSEGERSLGRSNRRRYDPTLKNLKEIV